MTQTQTPSSILGQYAPDFELPGVDGEVYHLASALKPLQGLGVIFMGNECPYVRKYLDRLKQIQAEFSDRGFSLMAINANDTARVPNDNFEQMKVFAREQTLNFPYLRDPSQEVASGFGAETTPEVFLIDKNGIVCYCGAIDDGGETSNPYLENAIAALLAEKPISPEETQAIGTPLQWRDT
ncbi:MAG: thioredoxin family protein [Cyanobacteria bacterium P01_E01_bin.42]